MGNRDVDDGDRAGELREPPAPSLPFGDLVLRTPPNWTAVGFLGLLGALHLTIAVSTFISGRWESYLSLIIGTVFVVVASVIYRCRFELAVLPSQRSIRLRYGLRRFCSERFIPFRDIRGVRLTLSNDDHARRGPESKIELLCPYEDVLCPPTHIPRQQALFLAMAINVTLTKVSDEPAESDLTDAPSRVTEMPTRRL